MKTADFIRAALEAETDECIDWPYSIVNGYGVINQKERRGYVHRFICIAKHGRPPTKRHQAAHSCNNPPCCNWRHLRWATPKENQHDRIAAGTGHSAIRKLTIEQVHWLWANRTTLTRAEMAKALGVHCGTVGAIFDGRTYVSWRPSGIKR